METGEADVKDVLSRVMSVAPGEIGLEVARERAGVDDVFWVRVMVCVSSLGSLISMV